MGSDSVKKSSTIHSTQPSRFFHILKSNVSQLIYSPFSSERGASEIGSGEVIVNTTRKIVLAVSSFLLFILCLHISITSYYKFSNRSTFSSPTIPKKLSPQEIQSIEQSIPPQCHTTLHKILQCQQNTQDETIVFACHRQWCNSLYGHCEKVNGIGDRTKHMLSMMTDASIEKCLRVELDYPQGKNGVELRLEDFVYRDKWGVIADWLHFRSYDVSDLKVNVNEWGTSSSKSDETTTVAATMKTKRIPKKTFAHFIPSKDQYTFHDYDPCLYHILFKSTSILETELQYYSHLIGLDYHHTNNQDQTNQQQPQQNNNDNNNVIGMHFRTGDLVAFGLKNNDVRTSSNTLFQSYNQMISCAQKHAHNLNITPNPTTNKLKIFLATDNQSIKDFAKQDERVEIYMTHDKPSAYVRSEGDRSAYTDLYLLSKTRGLVVNELPRQYMGRLAEEVSTFAQLAMKIGFMDQSRQLYRCKLLT